VRGMGKTQMAYENSTMTLPGNHVPTTGNCIFTRRTKADKALQQLHHLAVKVLDAPNHRRSTPLAACGSHRHNRFIGHV